jgi:hypothetical protein
MRSKLSARMGYECEVAPLVWFFRTLRGSSEQAWVSPDQLECGFTAHLPLRYVHLDRDFHSFNVEPRKVRKNRCPIFWLPGHAAPAAWP